MTSPRSIEHPLLARRGVGHGFCAALDGADRHVLRPRQVHGTDVAEVRGDALDRDEADAVVSTADAGNARPVGVVTADCVPVLACSADGSVVAAIHAGWRGLAAGVVSAGIRALRERAPASRVTAVIGPHIGLCCYEVDAAVLDPLCGRFGRGEVDAATVASRPGHRRLSLGRLVELELERSGVRPTHRARSDACTYCDPRRFESFRRDGPRAGRMLHFIAPSPESRRTAASQPGR